MNKEATFFNKMTNVVLGICQFSEKINKHIISFAQNYEEFGKKLFEISLKFTNFLVELNLSSAIVNEILDRYDWWALPFKDLSMKSLLTLIVEIKDLPHEEGKEKLDNFILELYRKDNHEKLLETVNSWNLPYFNERRHILVDALEAHKTKKFTLTIPALACQIEGILRDWHRANCSNDNKSVKESIINIIKRNFDYKDIYKKRNLEFIKNPSFEKMFENKFDLHEIQRQYFLDRVVQFFKYANFEELTQHELQNSPLNRNLIAHGLYLSYNTHGEIDSLKLFLLLELLHNILTIARDNDNLA